MAGAASDESSSRGLWALTAIPEAPSEDSDEPSHDWAFVKHDTGTIPPHFGWNPAPSPLWQGQEARHGPVWWHDFGAELSSALEREYQTWMASCDGGDGARPWRICYIFRQTQYNIYFPEFVQKNTRTGEFGPLRRVRLDTDRFYRTATLVYHFEPPCPEVSRKRKRQQVAPAPSSARAL